MYGSSSWEIQQNVLKLIALAEKRGVDEEEWFLRGLNDYSVRGNLYLYQKLVHMCLHNSGKPFLPTTFPVPFKEEDLEAVDGIYKIGRIADTDIELS